MMYAPDVVPPLNGVHFTSWALVGLIFQWFMRRYHSRWWLRYNYPLAAGLDVGVIIGMYVLLFSLQMWPNGGTKVNWWGNYVWKNTADAQLTPLKMLALGVSTVPFTVYGRIPQAVIRSRYARIRIRMMVLTGLDGTVRGRIRP